MKKIIFIILFIMILCCSCSKKNENLYEKYFIDKSDVYINRLKEYDTNNSFCFENSFGDKELYLFSGPVRYKNKYGNLEMINNGLKPVIYKNGKYFKNNANSFDIYIPQNISKNSCITLNDLLKVNLGDEKIFGKLKKYNNIFGDMVQAVEYKTSDYVISCFAMNYGILNEIYLKNNEFRFYITSDFQLNITNVNTVIIGETDNIIGIINKPIIIGSDGSIINEIQVSLEKNNNEYVVKYSFSDDCKGMKLCKPIEYRIEKTGDISLYSHNDEYSDYLSWFDIFGDKELGNCILLKRIMLPVHNIDINKIKSVKYYVPILNAQNSDFYMMKMKEDWCNKEVKYSDVPFSDLDYSICSYTKDKNFIVFDITEDYIHYYNNESRKGGMIFTNNNFNEKLVFLSNDNGYICNIIKVNFK